MTPAAYIFDPISSDPQSKVRGIGRYMKLLHNCFDAAQNTKLQNATSLNMACTFVSSPTQVPRNSILIDPFLNPIQKPLYRGRIAQKQVAVIHDLIPLKYPSHFPIGWRGWWYKLLNKWNMKNYDLIVTVSEQSKADVVNYLHVPAKNIQVIHPSVEPYYLPHLDTHEESVRHHHPFHLEMGKEISEFSPIPDLKLLTHEKLKHLREYIVYVGDVTWNKNLVNLAQAVKAANITCVCVGKMFAEIQTTNLTKKPNPWLYPFYEFIRETQNNPLFIFPGFIDDLELLALYRGAKANILPSYDEGFGLSYLEAGYMSTPSVLADIPVFHQIAAHSALFVNPSNPRDIAQKIAMLVYDKSVREKLAISAFDRAQKFRPEAFRAQWIHVIRSLQ